PTKLLVPAGGGQIDRTAEILGQILPPFFLAVGVHADEIAHAADRVDQAVINGRGGAGASVPLVLQGLADRSGPPLFALLVQRDEEFLPVARPDGINLPAEDGRSGVAVAGVLERPDERRSLLGPGLEQAFFLGDAIAVGAAPLRPVSALSGQR